MRGFFAGFLLAASAAGPAFSEVMSETSDHVTFALGDGLAYVTGTVSDSAAQVATVSLGIGFDSLFEQLNGAITEIHVKVLYDTTRMSFLAAEADPGWYAYFDAQESPHGVVQMQMTLDTTSPLHTASAGTREYGRLRFIHECWPQDSLPGGVNFSRNGMDNSVTVNGIIYSPGSEGWDDGSVDRMPDSAYHITLEIADTAVTGEVGEEFVLTEYATTDFRLSLVWQAYTFDTAKLEFRGFEMPPYFGGTVTLRSDTIVITALNFSGVDEGHHFPLVHLTLAPRCPLGNTSTVLNAVPGWLTVWVSECSGSIDPAAVSDPSVTIAMADTAAYRARYLGEPVTMQDDGQLLKFGVLMRSTFAAGMGSQSDTGLTMNIDWTPNLDFAGIDHYAPAVKFLDLSQGDLTAVYQTWDAARANYLPGGGDFDSLVTLKVRFDTAGFTPSWNNRYLRPKFIHDFGIGHGRTVVPDTVGCLRADSVNGILDAWSGGAFDSVEVLMGQLLAGGGSSSTACGEVDFYVRGTCAIDSFSVRITVPTWACIYGIIDRMTGVIPTFVNYHTYDIQTNSLFAGVGPTGDPVKVCRLRIGLKSPCLRGKPYGIGISVTNGKVWDYAAGGPMYAATNGSTITLKCSSTGTGCSSCGSGNVDDDIPDDPNAKVEPTAPSTFALHQNFPNPFNPATTIQFDLPVAAEWRIEIFNTLGQLIREFHGASAPGSVTVEWDASAYASGVYLYRATAADFVETRKMLLLK